MCPASAFSLKKDIPDETEKQIVWLAVVIKPANKRG